MIRTLLIALLTLLPLGAGAATSDWAANDQGRVRLIAAPTAVGEGGQVLLGLEFAMAPGWKVYWRQAGDAGYPPRIDWAGSTNLAGADIAWPAPTRFTVAGIDSIGYVESVIFPISVDLGRPGAPLAARAKVDYLTCKELCIPYTVDLALDLPAGPAAPSPQAARLAEWQARVPNADGPMTVESATLAGTTLTVAVAGQVGFDRPDLFLEGPADVLLSPPEITVGAQGQRLLATSSVEFLVDDAPLAGQPLTVTVVDGDRAVEQTVTVAAGAPPRLAPDPAGLLAMVAIALLGGLILNLMPCVLPVLSLKLLSVISHGGQERRQIRLGFLASAAGILTAFLILAGAAIALQGAGQAVGWGIQFQQPLFLTFMVALLVLFATNMWGWFEITLPGAVADVTTGAGGHGLAGHFVTGAFAALLATPCSAPFLGTAVGFALSQGALEILVIFVALGIGLALPYLLVAAMPALAARLPRPGRWMLVVRRILGVALIGTAAWLLAVMAAQVGATAAGAVAGAMGVAAFALWLRHRRPAWRPAGTAMVLAALIGAGGAVWALPPAAPGDGETTGPWVPWAPGAIAGMVDAGTVVFVDVTADWCLTCKVNKAVVLDQPPVAGRLAAPDVVAMKADWTNPDPAIADYLAGFGRYGIPFNVVYGPGAPAGIPLPELLTAESVEDALDRAAGPSPDRAAGPSPDRAAGPSPDRAAGPSPDRAAGPSP